MYTRIHVTILLHMFPLILWILETHNRVLYQTVKQHTAAFHWFALFAKIITSFNII